MLIKTIAGLAVAWRWFPADNVATAWSFPDTIGEMRYPQNDVTQLQTEVVGDALTVTIVYAKALRTIAIVTDNPSP